MNTKLDEMQQAVASYGLGGGLITLSLAEIANTMQQVAIILGCLIVALRLLHDILMFRKKFFK